jgi:hypothetical protein
MAARGAKNDVAAVMTDPADGIARGRLSQRPRPRGFRGNA